MSWCAVVVFPSKAGSHAVRVCSVACMPGIEHSFRFGTCSGMKGMSSPLRSMRGSSHTRSGPEEIGCFVVPAECEAPACYPEDSPVISGMTASGTSFRPGSSEQHAAVAGIEPGVTMLENPCPHSLNIKTPHLAPCRASSWISHKSC